MLSQPCCVSALAQEEHNGEMPPYFKFLTIMAFHVFLQEQVSQQSIDVKVYNSY